MLAPVEVLVGGLVVVGAIHGVHAPAARVSPPVTLTQVRREPLEAGTGERGGDSGNLPVGCRYSPDDLVNWARNYMPDVRAAMQEFSRRGYVAVPAGDTAVTGCAQGIPASGVMLAYLKPGAFIDSSHAVAPMILVMTRLHPITGEAFTQVSGGIIVADGAASLAYSGDSLAAFRTFDHSFDIVPALSGGGGGPRREPVRSERWDAVFDPNSRFNRFLTCAGWNTLGCIVGAIRLGMDFTPMKLALILGEPEIGLAILGGCALASALGCLPYLF
jgi:hypothetical protein